jgi:hypothetical protein
MKEIALELKRLNKTMEQILLFFQEEREINNERRRKYELEKEEKQNEHKQSR